ncbi:CPBP family intramembrane glutamic endopeptidase [Clostridium sp. KNHs214]|uniref:CPBP family intramembrane glutamic endopeptidase n=1 Tax=Clostridium sp. KNHs214 TaxID=1540257 RepID=UPI00054E1A80
MGLIKTCILIYFIELPAEELLYRGILLIPLVHIINPIIAVFISSILLSLLHIRTWNNKFIWIGSFFLGITCATSILISKSIWTAIIIHDLNDFAYITLVNRRNIFPYQKLE